MERTGIEQPTDAQLKQVWDVLDGLEDGEIVEVKKYAPRLPSLWIECAKMYHDCYKTIEFNQDYTKLKKLSNLI